LNWNFCSAVTKEERKPVREAQLAGKKHTQQDLKASENLTAGRLGGLTEVNSA